MPYNQPGYSNQSWAQKEKDKWYEENPLEEGWGQEGVEYDRDGRAIGGLENFKSEAHFDHDKGKNFATDRWGKTYTPEGMGTYTTDQAGYDLASEDAMEFHSRSGKKDEIPDYLQDWKAQKDSNMPAVDVTPQMQADREASTKPSPSGPSESYKERRARKNANLNEGKRLKRESVSKDKTLSWRQKRRLMSGDGQSAKSNRQLKRLRNQEARKTQRAKNRRERGWGGFGWNRPKNKKR